VYRDPFQGFLHRNRESFAKFNTRLRESLTLPRPAWPARDGDDDLALVLLALVLLAAGVLAL
jgi:hypothetical protein